MSLTDNARAALQANRDALARSQAEAEETSRRNAEDFTRRGIANTLQLSPNEIPPIDLFNEGRNYGVRQYYGEVTIDGLRFRRRNGATHLIHNGEEILVHGLSSLGLILERLNISTPTNSHDTWSR